MRTLTYRDAIREALIEEMERDPRVFAIGEDLIPQGGSFGVHRGLNEMFPGRILQTPISEAAIVGVAVGAALAGSRVVAEIMFGDFLTCCMDEIVNQAAKLRYMTGGQAEVPLVIRSPVGLGRNVAAQHSQTLEAWFAHVPGLKVALPATAADAKGMLKTAIRGRDPVMFLENKMLYAKEGPVPDGEHLVPLGQARICRHGRDLTLIATGRMVGEALEAAIELTRAGVDVEVIDPRTVAPVDWETLFASVRRTGRALVVEEANRHCSVGAELAASIGEHCFGDLDAPVMRLSAPDVPKPFSPPLEARTLPGRDDIVRSARMLVGA